MIRINLLPHRQWRKAALQRQFFIAAGTAAAAGIAVVMLTHGVINGRIESQQARNQYLQDQIVELDKQIEEIKKLKVQIQALLSRKQVVEALQTNRSDVVHLLDQLARELPDGVYLKSIKQTGNKVTMTGYAQSNARVSTLMRKLDASPWLESPGLVEIKAAQLGNTRVNEFVLNIAITHSQPQDAAATGKKPS